MSILVVRDCLKPQVNLIYFIGGSKGGTRRGSPLCSESFGDYTKTQEVPLRIVSLPLFEVFVPASEFSFQYFAEMCSEYLLLDHRDWIYQTSGKDNVFFKQ